MEFKYSASRFLDRASNYEASESRLPGREFEIERAASVAGVTGALLYSPRVSPVLIIVLERGGTN
jgi:hypothetical protein